MSADRDSWLSRTVPVAAASQRTPLDTPAPRVEDYRGETMAVVADTPDDYAADLRLSRLLECVRWSIADRARGRSACVAYLAMRAPIEDSAAWAAIEYDTSWIAGATAVVAAALAVREGDIERAARVLAEYNAEDIDGWEALVRADMARRGGA